MLFTATRVCPSAPSVYSSVGVRFALAYHLQYGFHSHQRLRAQLANRHTTRAPRSALRPRRFSRNAATGCLVSYDRNRPTVCPINMVDDGPVQSIRILFDSGNRMVVLRRPAHLGQQQSQIRRFRFYPNDGLCSRCPLGRYQWNPGCRPARPYRRYAVSECRISVRADCTALRWGDFLRRSSSTGRAHKYMEYQSGESLTGAATVLDKALSTGCNALVWVPLPDDGDPRSRLRGCSWPSQNPASIPNNPWDKRLRTSRRTCSAKYRM